MTVKELIELFEMSKAHHSRWADFVRPAADDLDAEVELVVVKKAK